tara:strand:+ start:3848 stop:4219 length:372 start_codon:yes stop_codon:yes gene_type:complete
MLAAYALTIGVGVRTVKQLQVISSFTNEVLWKGTIDALRMGCPMQSPSYEVDGRGWAAIYAGVLLTMITLSVFTLLHIEAMLNGGYNGMSVPTITSWFLTHTVRCLGSILLFYGAVHGAKRFA